MLMEFIVKITPQGFIGFESTVVGPMKILG